MYTSNSNLLLIVPFSKTSVSRVRFSLAPVDGTVEFMRVPFTNNLYSPSLIDHVYTRCTHCPAKLVFESGTTTFPKSGPSSIRIEPPSTIMC